MKRRSRVHVDDGSALLFAVIVVFVILMVVTSMLSLASGNLRSTSTYAEQSTVASVAESAVQTAANSIRRGSVITATGAWNGFNNAPNQRCFPGANGNLTPGSDTLALDDIAVQGGQQYSAVVTCTHSGGSSSPVLINSDNRPGMAILTTGNRAAEGEDGIYVKALNAIPVRVHGVIYSNSTITMDGGTLEDDNGVYAKGVCTGAAFITPTPICNYTGAVPSGADPGYPQPTVVPDYQGAAQIGSPPSALTLTTGSYPNACKNSVITFSPGYYDSAASLSKMMSSSGCDGSTFWFRPGLYYFDFHDGDDLALPPALHSWTINTGAMIAGTPVDSLGNVIPKPPLNPTLPGACRSPITNASAVGVQFVFGGDSQLVVDAARAEICGTYSTTSPPLAIYGATTGVETQTVRPALQMMPAPDAGDFVDLNGMRTAADGSVATWTNTLNGTKTGSSTISGFAAPGPPIPGTHLDSAKLTVTHSNSASANPDKRKVLIDLPNGTTITRPLPDRADNATYTDVIDLLDPVLATFVHDTGRLGPLSVTYSATVNHQGVESVDAITLELKYRLPAYRSQDSAVTGGNCLTLAYTGGGGSGCAAVTSKQAPGNQFYIQGTAYAPKAAMDITLNQVTSQVFKFGVVTRSLNLKVTGSSTFSQPLIEIPDEAPGSVVSTNVILRAHVCPATSGCAVTGSADLRSRIALIDPDPGAVIRNLRALDIQSWSTPMRAGG